MNKKMNLLLLAGSLTACAHGRLSSGGPRPSWIDGESARWPRSQYVLGVGGADSEASADERARAEVAAVFSATVTADSSVSETEIDSSKNGAKTNSFTQTIAQSVHTTTKQVLEGVQIVARWKNSATFRYYALAVLPKDQALLAVTEKLHDLDDETRNWQSQMEQASDRFSRAKAAAKVLALVKSRAALENESRVLGGGADAGAVDAGTARVEAAKALAALDVVVAVDGDGAREVATGVISGLNAAGMSAKSGLPGDPADLTAQAQVSVRPEQAPAGWTRTRADATVSLRDGRSGSIFAQLAPTAREDALDAVESRRRALASLAKTTAESVSKAVEKFFADQ